MDNQVMLPKELVAVAAPYLADPKTRTARIAFLNSLLTGMTVKPLPLDAVIRGIEDMAIAGADFRPVVVRTWCARALQILEGEAGRRAAESSVLRQPDANQSPSGWAEDEVEG